MSFINPVILCDKKNTPFRGCSGASIFAGVDAAFHLTSYTKGVKLFNLQYVF